MHEFAQLNAGAVPAELDARLKQELEPGERLVWMEQPVPRFFTAASTPTFIFAIPWTAFAVFWTAGAAEFKVPDFRGSGFDFFPLAGLPFIAIGIGLLCSPLWAYRKALKSVYALTDRRAITIEGGWTTLVRSFAPDQLRNVHRKDRRGGIGDVVLAQEVVTGSKGGQRVVDHGFLGVREPRKVEQMVRRLAGRDQAGLLSG